MSKENLEAGFYRQFFKFLEKNQNPTDISPYDAASIMNRDLLVCNCCWVFYR